MKLPVRTPYDANYKTWANQYEQLVNNSEPVTLSDSGDVSASIDPRILLDGSGFAYIQGQITIDSNPSADMPLAVLPEDIITVADYFVPVVLLRAGAAVSNTAKIYSDGFEVESVTITSPGNYATMPTLGVTGPGFGAILSPRAYVSSAVVAARGTGYVPGNTITLAGGTSTSTSVLTVNNTCLVGISLNNSGNGYQVGDIVVFEAGDGTVTVRPAVTLDSVQLTVIQVQSGGAGYSVGNTITLAGGTSSTAAIVTVSAVSGGAVTAVTITNSGDYTVAPTSFTQASTSGSGSGVAFHNCQFGPKTWTISTRGVFTANPTFFTQFSTTGSGVAATWNTPVIGVNAVTPTTPGNYSVLPSSPVAQASTSGSGTGATFTPTWSLATPVVVSGGSGYTDASQLAIFGGGGLGGGAGTLTLNQTTQGLIELVNAPQVGDVVCFATPPLLLKKYK